jgi:hypothetical protein
MNANQNYAIRIGLIGGLVMAIIGILSYVFYRQLFGSLMTQISVSFLFLVIMVFIPVWGTISYKQSVGQVTFAQALSACMTIIFIMMLCSNIVTYIIPNYLDTEYPEQVYDLMRRTTESAMEKMNATDEQIEEALSRFSVEQFRPTLGTVVRSLGMTLGLGFVLSLIVALFVSRDSRRKPEAEEKQEA